MMATDSIKKMRLDASEEDRHMEKQNTRFFSGGIKALLSGMLVVLMLGSAAASATEVDPNYVPPPVYTSGDYSYYINEDKTSVTICGYEGDAEELVIPTELDGYPVTEIGYQAFSYVKVKSLTIPDRIREIQRRAFEYCVVSERFTLPEDVFIGGDAFSYASLPDLIVIPRGAQLDRCAFSYCKTGETLIVQPGAVIGERCFGYSKQLKTVFCESGSVLKADAFEYCRVLEQAILCSDVQMDEDAFSYCGSARFLVVAPLR
jgi:hypothetical protein